MWGKIEMDRLIVKELKDSGGTPRPLGAVGRESSRAQGIRGEGRRSRAQGGPPNTGEA